jgi:hypothetical protein
MKSQQNAAELLKIKLICAVNGLQISEDLGKGLQLGTSLVLVNNREHIATFISSDLQYMMGSIEYNHLLKTGCAFCGDIEFDEVGEESKVQHFLGQWLQIARVYFQCLWLIRDNAVNCELGFAEWNHLLRGKVCSSNFIAVLNPRVDGTLSAESFSLDELKIARTHFNDALLPLAFEHAKSASDWKERSRFHKGSRRLARFNYFVAAARAEAEPAARVSLYMTCLEILFSTDAAELTHKLSERVAVFLGQNANERREIFSKMKRAYAIRSKVVHGATLSDKDETDAKVSASSVDELIRRVFLKIIESKEIADQFDKSNLDEYFLELLFNVRG